jgi:hypothetical protein
MDHPDMFVQNSTSAISNAPKKVALPHHHHFQGRIRRCLSLSWGTSMLQRKWSLPVATVLC